MDLQNEYCTKLRYTVRYFYESKEPTERIKSISDLAAPYNRESDRPVRLDQPENDTVGYAQDRTSTSVADPGCLSRILIFTHPGSRIPDSKTAMKDWVKKNLLYLFLGAINFTKLIKEL
jgi:hypothetical protein